MNEHSMQTYTGRVMDLAKITEEDIDILDVAHALSNIVRFTGHANKPYTVAQHSLVVSDLCPDGCKLWGLLHDASEAYLGDVSSPLKSLLPDYRAIERRVQRVIARRFGLRWPEPKQVKAADRQALYSEKRILFARQIEWPGEADAAPLSIEGVISGRSAKDRFLAKYRELTGEDARR